MSESKFTAPHVTAHHHPDVTELVTDEREAGLVELPVEVSGRVRCCPAHAPFERLARAKTAEAAQRFERLLGEVVPEVELRLQRVATVAAGVHDEEDRVREVALEPEEVDAFERILEEVIRDNREAFASGLIAESPDRLRRLPAYFRALNGDAEFPENTCNAPWTSTVVEADGTVRPCFFHEPIGNLHEEPLGAILNSERAVAFRRELDVSENPVCESCTCTLHVAPHEQI